MHLGVFWQALVYARTRQMSDTLEICKHFQVQVNDRMNINK